MPRRWLSLFEPQHGITCACSRCTSSNSNSRHEASVAITTVGVASPLALAPPTPLLRDVHAAAFTTARRSRAQVPCAGGKCHVCRAARVARGSSTPIETTRRAALVQTRGDPSRRPSRFWGRTRSAGPGSDSNRESRIDSTSTGGMASVQLCSCTLTSPLRHSSDQSLKH